MNEMGAPHPVDEMQEDDARMNPTLWTRRQILASGAALAGTIPLLPLTRAIAAPQSASEKLLLTAGTRTIEVSGKPARVFGLTPAERQAWHHARAR
jgi:hypothetical protein